MNTLEKKVYEVLCKHSYDGMLEVNMTDLAVEIVKAVEPIKDVLAAAPAPGEGLTEAVGRLRHFVASDDRPKSQYPKITTDVELVCSAALSPSPAPAAAATEKETPEQIGRRWAQEDGHADHPSELFRLAYKKGWDNGRASAFDERRAAAAPAAGETRPGDMMRLGGGKGGICFRGGSPNAKAASAALAATPPQPAAAATPEVGATWISVDERPEYGSIIWVLVAGDTEPLSFAWHGYFPAGATHWTSQIVMDPPPPPVVTPDARGDAK